MKKVILLLMTLFFAQASFALTLDEAKQQGLIGETFSGYVAVVDKNNKQANELAVNINQARKQKYDELAKTNRMTTSNIAKIAGQKLVERAAKGEYVLGINGQWTKK